MVVLIAQNPFRIKVRILWEKKMITAIHSKILEISMAITPVSVKSLN